MAPKDGPKGYSKGKNGDSLSRGAQEEVSRTLVRILRYEKSNYSLDGPDGWVELDALLTNCRSQLKNFQRSEVLWVAQTSEGSKGPRFEVDPSYKWVRARYKHDPSGEKGEKGKGKGGKSGKGKSGGSNGKGYNGSNGYNESNGWENYRPGVGSNEANGSSTHTRPPWQDAYNGGGEDPWQKSDPWQKPSWRYEKEGQVENVENVENVEPKNAAAQSYTGNVNSASSAKEAPQHPPPHGAPRVPPVPLGANRSDTHETREHGHTNHDSNLRGAESFDISTPRNEEKTWYKYTDPANKRVWLWNSETNEYFYEDAARHRGWSQYASDSGNWWHHDETGRWFFDPELAA